MELPDFARPDVAGIVIRTWRTDDQLRAADAAVKTWRSRPWPSDCLTRSVLLGEDGRLVMHYEQWNSHQLGYRLVDATPGCSSEIVIVSFGVSKVARQRRLVDLMRAHVTPGTYLHASTDGAGVVAWTGRDTWSELDELPWVERLSSQRFRPHAALAHSSAATARSA
ncbi:hypothetical protein [Kutzneria sp. NPDC051319]|uniref:hypothetical protein n=1 Tax=Kutzneria sp. NPDC051319 TaxID=3155047 RepID=UPI00341261D0